MVWRTMGLGLVSLCLTAPVCAQSKSPFGPPISELGGATLLNHDWFTFRDYPPEALRGNEQGRVVISFDITPKGRAKNCKVKISSGHHALDVTPCEPLEHSARFQPAVAENGSPIATKATLSFDFWTPPPPR